MVTRSRLRQAIANEKGIDLKKQKQQKKIRELMKRKAVIGDNEYANAEKTEIVEKGLPENDEYDEISEVKFMNLDAVDDSDTSESSLEFDEKIIRQPNSSIRQVRLEGTSHGETASGAGRGGFRAHSTIAESNEDHETDEEDIPISDLEDLNEDEKEDLIPHTRLTINNTLALTAALDRIAIPTNKSVPFATHQCMVSSTETAISIPDVSDDLQRELAFYSQCLEAARQGRTRLILETVPFTRPKDYFAEMVKEDAHMEKVKSKLIEEASSKKAAAEARKLRDLKKFGKQVQVAKLQERQKAKRETLEKIKTLKRKRQESSGDVGTNEADLFDVGVDNEIGRHSRPAEKSLQGTNKNHKRQKKNEKYGFGGKKRHAKSGDAVSSGDLGGFNARKMKGLSRTTKNSRPGKGRRKVMATR